jgi:hypothetical protein
MVTDVFFVVMVLFYYSLAAQIGYSGSLCDYKTHLDIGVSCQNQTISKGYVYGHIENNTVIIEDRDKKEDKEDLISSSQNQREPK